MNFKNLRKNLVMALVCELGSAMSFCSEIWSSAELNKYEKGSWSLFIKSSISLNQGSLNQVSGILAYYTPSSLSVMFCSLYFGHLVNLSLDVVH